jgi:hypothetical protein
MASMLTIKRSIFLNFFNISENNLISVEMAQVINTVLALGKISELARWKNKT